MSLVAWTDTAGVLTRVMGVSNSSRSHSYYRCGYITVAMIDRDIWGVNYMHTRDIMPPQEQYTGFVKVTVASSLSDELCPSNTVSTQ